MSTINPSFMTPGGEPITGRTPTQIIVYGDLLTPGQRSLVEAAYRSFAASVRLSAAADGYHTKHRTLVDGTKVRMESNSGLERVLVWPAGSDEDGDLKTFFCIPYDFDNQGAEDVYYVKRWPDAKRISPTAILNDLKRDKKRKVFLVEDEEGEAQPGNTTWFARTAPAHKHKGIVVSWWGLPCRYGNTKLTTTVAASVAPDYFPVPAAPPAIWLNGRRIGIAFTEGSDEVIQSACIGTRTAGGNKTSVLRILSGKKNPANTCYVPYCVYEVALSRAIDKAKTGGSFPPDDLDPCLVTGLTTAIGVANDDAITRAVQPAYWNADGSECLGICEVDYGGGVDAYTRYGTVVFRLKPEDKADDEPKDTTAELHSKSSYSETLNIDSSDAGAENVIDSAARKTAGVLTYGHRTGLDINANDPQYPAPDPPDSIARVVTDEWERSTARGCGGDTSVTADLTLAVDYVGNTATVLRYVYSETASSDFSSSHVQNDTIIDAESPMPTPGGSAESVSGTRSIIETVTASRTVSVIANGSLLLDGTVVETHTGTVTLAGNSERTWSQDIAATSEYYVPPGGGSVYGSIVDAVATTAVVSNIGYTASLDGVTNYYHVVSGDLRSGSVLLYAEPARLRGLDFLVLRNYIEAYPSDMLTLTNGVPNNAVYQTANAAWTSSPLETYFSSWGLIGNLTVLFDEDDAVTETSAGTSASQSSSRTATFSAAVSNALATSESTYALLRLTTGGEAGMEIATEARIAKPDFRDARDMAITVPAEWNTTVSESWAYSPTVPTNPLYPRSYYTDVPPAFTFSIAGAESAQGFYPMSYGFLTTASAPRAAVRTITSDAQIGTDVSRPNGVGVPWRTSSITNGFCPYGFSASAASPDAQQTYLAFTSKEAADINSTGVSDTMAKINVDKWVVNGVVAVPAKEYPYTGDYTMLSSPIFTGPLPPENMRTFP